MSNWLVRIAAALAIACVFVLAPLADLLPVEWLQGPGGALSPSGPKIYLRAIVAEDGSLLRELAILAVAFAVGMLGGYLGVRRTPPEKLAWPMRLQLLISRLGRLPARQQEASRREQFLAAFFAWFFIAFVAGILFFGCTRRMGCA